MQKFELLSLALLGVPSMAEKFLQVSENLKPLCFDSADYVCLKLIIPLNAGLVRDFNNKQHLYERIQQAHQILLEYCQTCYPNVPEKYNQLLAQIDEMRLMAHAHDVFEAHAGLYAPPCHPPHRNAPCKKELVITLEWFASDSVL